MLAILHDGRDVIRVVPRKKPAVTEKGLCQAKTSAVAAFISPTIYWCFVEAIRKTMLAIASEGQIIRWCYH